MNIRNKFAMIIFTMGCIHFATPATSHAAEPVVESETASGESDMLIVEQVVGPKKAARLWNSYDRKGRMLPSFLKYAEQRYLLRLILGVTLDVFGTAGLVTGIAFAVASHKEPGCDPDYVTMYCGMTKGLFYMGSVVAFISGGVLLTTGLVITRIVTPRYRKLSAAVEARRTLAKQKGLRFRGVSAVTSPFSKAPVGASLQFSF